MAKGSTEARVVYRDDAVVVGFWEDCFFQRWRSPGGASSVQGMLEAHRRFVDGRPPRSTVSLSHVESTSMRPPDEAARAVMKEHTKLLSDHVRAAATVIESSGFGSAMIRSIVSGLVLISRGGLAHEVFGDLSDGMRFLLKNRAPGATPIERSVLEELCRAALYEEGRP